MTDKQSYGMTDERLAEIEARLSAATQGPWHPDKYTAYIWGPSGEMVAEQDLANHEVAKLAVCRIRGAGAGLPMEANMQFIAHSPADISALLSEVRRLRSLAPAPLDDKALREILAEEYDRLGLRSFAFIVRNKARYPGDAAMKDAALAAVRRVSSICNRDAAMDAALIAEHAVGHRLMGAFCPTCKASVSNAAALEAALKPTQPTATAAAVDATNSVSPSCSRDDVINSLLKHMKRQKESRDGPQREDWHLGYAAACEEFDDYIKLALQVLRPEEQTSKNTRVWNAAETIKQYIIDNKTSTLASWRSTLYDMNHIMEEVAAPDAAKDSK